MMKSNHLDHEQNYVSWDNVSKECYTKILLRKSNGTKTAVEEKGLYKYILSIIRMRYDNKTQCMTN